VAARARAATAARRRNVRLIAASVSLGSPLAVALLGVVVLVELGLLAWALIDLAKRPADRVAGGSRLLWLLLCLLLQLIGPVIYLIVGRLRATPAGVPPPRTPGGDGHVARAAAALYDAAGQGAHRADGGALAGSAAAEKSGRPAVELVAVHKVFRATAALDGLERPRGGFSGAHREAEVPASPWHTLGNWRIGG